MSDQVNDFDSVDKFESLIKLSRKGDQNQLGVLLDLYRGYLMTIAADRLATDVVAKAAPSDVVQETFLHASQALEQFCGATEPEFRAWLKQILKRVITDTHRSFKNIDKRDVSREVSIDLISQNEDPVNVFTTAATPSSLMMTAEKFSALHAALSRLSKDHRQAIQLRTFQQLGFEAIGKQLGRSADAARKLWIRAIQNLNLELKNNDPGSA